MRTAEPNGVRQDAQQIAARLRRAAAELVEIVLLAPDPIAIVPATPEWSVREVFAHIAIETDRYAREMEGDSDWSRSALGIAETKREALRRFEVRDLGALRQAVVRNVDRYVTALLDRDLDRRSHALDGGLLLTPRAAAGVLPGELGVHTRDVAEATGRRHHVRADDAAFILDGLFAAMPAFVDPDRGARFSGVFDVKLRGGHRTRRLTFDRGRVDVDGPAGSRPDATVSADPVAMLLVSYGRATQFQVLRRLSVVAWGRRPHRALLMRRVVRNP